MKRALVALAFVVFFYGAAPAYSQVDPINSFFADCLTLSPGPRFPNNPIGGYVVSVHDVNDVAVEGASVTITFSPEAIALVAWCGGTPPGGGVVNASTDAIGVARFEFFGGGCLDGAPCVAPAFTIDVVGPAAVGGSFSLTRNCIRSPDAIGDDALRPSCPSSSTCNMLGYTSCNLSDIVFHTRPIKLGLLEPCTKLTPPWDGAPGVSDAVYITQYAKAGGACTCQ